MAIEPKPVHFQEAIDFFRQKVSLPTKAYTDLWEGMHARAFVVAGATKDGLVSDLRAAVDKAITAGTTLAEFNKDFDKAVADHQWQYKGNRAWRTATIFNTNLRMAYSAGKWDQAQRLKERRPYGRYVHTPSANERKEHAAWHGTIVLLDDPWVATHWAPNGWGCKCTWQTLSARDAKALGYDPKAPPPVTEWETVPVNTPNGPVDVRTPKGIDPGFGYNVGEAAWGRGAQSIAMEKHGAWEALDAPGQPTMAGPLKALAPKAKLGHQAPDGDEVRMRELLRQALGGDSRVFADPLGGRVSVGQGIADHIMAKPTERWGRQRYFPLISELVEAPQEIWVGWTRNSVSGRVAIRRRYVRLLDLGKDKTFGLVADADNGQWSGLTVFHGQPSGLVNLRKGLRIYRQS
jgi:hypothetical protein